jgi:class 3 adenylate cyclase/tetratricopeptide (TPR) repeat protein
MTFLFTDVVGSTSLADSLGDEGAQDIMRTHNALVRAEVARHGGSEVKAMGDGFMIAFRSVSSALACAVGIQQAVAQHNQDQPTREFMVRMGLNSGEAIHEEADFFGTAVIVAARIAAMADGSEILTSAAVKQLAQGMRGIEYQFKGEYTLKGLREPYQVYEVLSGPAARPGQALLRRSRFVGRTNELEELMGLVELAVSGSGRLALITGEPGIGKSRLAEEAVRLARSRGLRVLSGRCYETEGAPPYAPFVEILRRYAQDRPDDVLIEELGDGASEIAKLLPELLQRIILPAERSRLPPEQERYRLLEAVRNWLETLARRRPTLLFIEDLHWAAPGTSVLLRHLAPTVAGGQTVILATSRDDNAEPSSPLGAALAEYARLQAYHRVALQGLTRTALAELLAGVGGGQPPQQLIEALVSQTDGNPFFVSELVNHLDAEGKLLSDAGAWLPAPSEEWDVPDTVRAVIQRRLAGLPQETRGLLAVAAVIGKDFSYDLLETLEEVPAWALLDGLDEALRMGMIEEAEGAAARFRFAHQLTQQTLYQDLSSLRRQRLHLRVGDAMERLRPVVAAELADHYTRAGRMAPSEKARKYLVLAGHDASRTAAWEGAAAYYQQALVLADGGEERERADLLRRLGEARAGQGEWEDAIAAWREAMDIFERLGDAEAAGWLGFALRRLYGARGQFEEAYEVVQRSLALLGDADSEIRSRLLAQAGFVKGAFGEKEEAERLISQSMEIAERTGNQAATGFSALIRGMNLLSYSHLSSAAEWLGKGAESALAAADVWTASQCTSFRRHILFTLGELEQAGEAMDEEERLARRAGNFLAVCETRWILGGIACLKGEPEKAESLWNELIALIEAAQAYSGLPGAFINLAYARFLRGDWQQLESTLAQALEWYERMSSAPIDDPRPVSLLLRALTGETEAACAMLPDMERYFDFESHWTASLGEARVTLATGLVALGEQQSASRLYEPLKQWTAESGYVLSGASSIPQLASRVLGMLAGAAGEDGAAERHFEMAMNEATSRGLVTEKAETAYWYGRHLRAREDGRGDELLTYAVRLWSEAGMDRQADRVNKLKFAAE